MAKFEQQAERGSNDPGTGSGGKHVALVVDHDVSEQVAHEITERFGSDVELALIAPAVTRTRFEHAAGNADDARAEAEERIDHSLPALDHEGLHPEPAAVGDQDPVIAIEDALREFGDLDEVVFVTNSGASERWAEHDAFSRVRQRIDLPVTHLEVSDDGSLLESERSEPGRDPAADAEIGGGGGGNLPPFTRQDFFAVVVAIVGTLLLLVVAAINISQADNPGAGLELGDLVAALLALTFFLINTWHVVAIFMFESIGYRGTGAQFFARLSLYGTPLALLVTVLVTI